MESGLLLEDEGYAYETFLMTPLADLQTLSTAGLQPCPCQNKGSNWNDLWPSEIPITVPAPPKGLPRTGPVMWLLHAQCCITLPAWERKGLPKWLWILTGTMLPSSQPNKWQTGQRTVYCKLFQLFIYFFYLAYPLIKDHVCHSLMCRCILFGIGSTQCVIILTNYIPLHWINNCIVY